jgi:O-antigen ligase
MATRKRAAAPEGRPGGRARLWMLLALLVAVPLAIDTSHRDVFSTVKFAVLVGGVGVLVAAAVVDWAATGRRPRWRSPLLALALAVAAWTGVSTATGVSPGYSILGQYASYDGLVAALVFAALFFVVFDTVRLADLRRVATVVYFGAGGPVALHSLLQLHDAVVKSGPRWDVFDFSHLNLPATWVFSTFGNPNHLAAFFALLLPIGVVLAVAQGTRWVRALAAGQAVVIGCELAYTTTRGAWLGAIAAFAVLGAVFARDLVRERRALVTAVAAVGGAAVLLAALTVSGVTRGLPRQFASIFDPQGVTTVERVEMWRAAWDMALDRPAVGVGPDAYRLLFNRYQGARYVEEFGPRAIANGPHGVFFAHLAGGGFPQLALFATTLGVAGVTAVRVTRRLARREAEEKPGPARAAAREDRLFVAGFVAATVAFVVQALFNTQEIDLSCWLWALLGILAAVAADTGEPPASPRPTPWLAVPACATAVVVAVLALWWGSKPYRADGRAAAAEPHMSLALGYSSDQRFDRAAGEAVVAESLFEEAFALSPRTTEHRLRLGAFHLTLAERELKASRPDVKADGLRRLEKARLQYLAAVRIQDQNAGLLRAYVEALMRIDELAGADVDVSGELRRALAAAAEANPWDRQLAAANAEIGS